MKANITILHDPAGICKRELHDVSCETKILDWLISKYGTGGFEIPTVVYEGAVCSENEILRTPMPIDEVDQYIIDNKNKKFKSGEQYTIIHTPQNPLVVFGISLVVGAVSTLLLMPKPNLEVPEQPEYQTPNESPNNSLSGQTNIARPFQRIPDLYGTNRVWPDLIMPSYTEYVSNIKYVTEYMCIGRGSFSITNVKNGENSIDEIEGQNYDIYEPYEISPNPLKVTESNQVDGQELASPNDVGYISITGMSGFFSGSNFITEDSDISQFASFPVGSQFTISNSDLNNGTFTFRSYYEEPPYHEGNGVDYWQYFIGVDETFTSDSDGGFDIGTTAGKETSYGPFPVPGNPDEIWINVIAPRGLQLIDGSTRSGIKIEFTATVQELDENGSDVGSPQLFYFSMEANTQDAQYRTFKINAAAGLNNPGNPHEVSLERTTSTTNDSTKQVFDLTKWESMSGVEHIDVPNFGDVTTIKTITKATEQATKIQRKELNCVATRKLYPLLSSGILGDELVPTTKMSDAAMHIMMDEYMGNKSISQIDGEALYALQNNISGDAIYGDDLGKFCYSFSNVNTPVADELRTCLNAARSFFYREGSTIRFIRDQRRDLRSALFNKRNKSPADSSKIISFNRPNDFNGVELQWVDQYTGEPSTIFFPEPDGSTRNKKIKAAGIKNYNQAWNRAKYEYLRLIYQRKAVKETVTKDGLLVIPNDRVANVDGTDIKRQDGEVKGISGLYVETTDEIDFEGESSGSVILRDEEGVPSDPITVTPRGDGIKGFLLSTAPLFTIMVRGDSDYQIGTLYSFVSGSEDNHLADDYLVQEIKPSSGNYVELSLINYSEEVYAPDTEEPT